MTLVVLQPRPEKGDIRVMADSRLCNSDGSVLTDHMPKLFAVHVTCHDLGTGERQVGTCGIAFAGSATVAFATISTVQGYLSNLSRPLGSPFPSLVDVSSLCQRVVLSVWRDFGFLWGPIADVELFVFGGLGEEPLAAYHLRTRINSGEAQVSQFQCDVSGDGLYAIGSGTLNYMNALQQQALVEGKMEPWNVLDDQINDAKVPDVGGSLQVALATSGAITMPIVARPTPERGEGVFGGFFLGRMDIENVGGCSVGAYLIK